MFFNECDVEDLDKEDLEEISDKEDDDVEVESMAELEEKGDEVLNAATDFLAREVLSKTSCFFTNS